MRIRNGYFKIHINFTLMETAVCITPVWNTGTYTQHCMQSHSMCRWLFTHEYPHAHTNNHDSTKWDSSLGQETTFLDMNGKVYCNTNVIYFPSIFLVFVSQIYLPMGLINTAECENNRKSYIIHSMKFKHTEYQQILQTRFTDNNMVHILYATPIFLLQNNVASPLWNFIILGQFFTDNPNYYNTTTLQWKWKCTFCQPTIFLSLDTWSTNRSVSVLLLLQNSLQYA